MTKQKFMVVVDCSPDKTDADVSDYVRYFQMIFDASDENEARGLAVDRHPYISTGQQAIARVVLLSIVEAECEDYIQRKYFIPWVVAYVNSKKCSVVTKITKNHIHFSIEGTS